MVLVDSSVWIKFFKSSKRSILSELIHENLVVTNQVILSELIPSATHLREMNLVEGLQALPKLEMNIDWDGLRLLQLMNLQNGVNKVGIPDLIIIQQAIQNKTHLWSDDKHFALMSTYVDIKLFKAN